MYKPTRLFSSPLSHLWKTICFHSIYKKGQNSVGPVIVRAVGSNQEYPSIAACMTSVKQSEGRMMYMKNTSLTYRINL